MVTTMKSFGEAHPRPPAAALFRVCGMVLACWAPTVFLLTTSVWATSIEGLWPSWMFDARTPLGAAAAAGLAGAALTVGSLSLRGLIRIVAWIVVVPGLLMAPAFIITGGEAHAPLSPAVVSVAVAVWASAVVATLLAALIMTAGWRVGIGRLRYTRRQARQAGAALLLGAGVWIAALRAGVGTRVYPTADLVVFGPPALACLGLVGLAWHGLWRAVWTLPSFTDDVPFYTSPVAKAPPPPKPDPPATPAPVPPHMRPSADPVARRFAMVDLSGLPAAEPADPPASPVET